MGKLCQHLDLQRLCFFNIFFIILFKYILKQFHVIVDFKQFFYNLLYIKYLFLIEFYIKIDFNIFNQINKKRERDKLMNKLLKKLVC